MSSYTALKAKQEKEFGEFPIMYAFSRKQFEEGMKEKLGLEPTDVDKIYSIGSGGYIRKEDSEKLKELMNRLTQEQKDAIDGDTTGEGYIYDMFAYELGNHEFDVTWDLSETLSACGLSMASVFEKPNIEKGLRKALKKYRACWLLDNAKECYEIGKGKGKEVEEE